MCVSVCVGVCVREVAEPGRGSEVGGVLRAAGGVGVAATHTEGESVCVTATHTHTHLLTPAHRQLHGYE